MIKNLRESKAHLSDLVDRASRGEEIIITVHGIPKARLCPIAAADSAKTDVKWGRKLKEARSTYSTGKLNSSATILDEIRGDRV